MPLGTSSALHHLEQVALRVGEKADPQPVSPDLDPLDRSDYRAPRVEQARLKRVEVRSVERGDHPARRGRRSLGIGEEDQIQSAFGSAEDQLLDGPTRNVALQKLWFAVATDGPIEGSLPP